MSLTLQSKSRYNLPIAWLYYIFSTIIVNFVLLWFTIRGQQLETGAELRAAAEEMLTDEDEEIREMAHEELSRLEAEKETLEQHLRQLLGACRILGGAPHDKNWRTRPGCSSGCPPGASAYTARCNPSTNA